MVADGAKADEEEAFVRCGGDGEATGEEDVVGG
jgi:hypothetical protein